MEWRNRQRDEVGVWDSSPDPSAIKLCDPRLHDADADADACGAIRARPSKQNSMCLELELANTAQRDK